MISSAIASARHVPKKEPNENFLFPLFTACWKIKVKYGGGFSGILLLKNILNVLYYRKNMTIEKEGAIPLGIPYQKQLIYCFFQIDT